MRNNVRANLHETSGGEEEEEELALSTSRRRHGNNFHAGISLVVNSAEREPCIRPPNIGQHVFC